VRLLGRDPRDARERLEIRRRLGYLPQEPGFHRGFTVTEFVDYVAILKEMTGRRERRDEVRRVVDLVGLTDVADRRIRALSGGMRRRVGVAQALLGDPELVVMDEPTAGLDPEQRLRFRDLVSRIGEGRTVILSTHQTEDVAALCPHVVVLDGGRTVFDGSPAGLTSTAEGRVWLAAERSPAARLAWRTADGDVRNIGDEVPAGARPLRPTLEDAYLLLVGERAATEVAA
jgi:ABC-2 type transport system ATP-binding protein